MRKAISVLAVMLISLALCSPAFASVGMKVDGTQQGTATDLNFSGSAFTITNDGSTWNIAAFGSTTIISAGIANGGAVSLPSSTTTIPVTYSVVRKNIDTSDPLFLAGTLADGTAGQLLSIYITEGSGTYVLTPSTSTSISTLTFNAVGDSVTLLYVDDTSGWMVVSINSVTVTQP